MEPSEVEVKVDRKTLRCTVRSKDVLVFDNYIYEWTVSHMFKVLDSLGVSYDYKEL